MSHRPRAYPATILLAICPFLRSLHKLAPRLGIGRNPEFTQTQTSIAKTFPPPTNQTNTMGTTGHQQPFPNSSSSLVSSLEPRAMLHLDT